MTKLAPDNTLLDHHQKETVRPKGHKNLSIDLTHREWLGSLKKNIITTLPGAHVGPIAFQFL